MKSINTNVNITISDNQNSYSQLQKKVIKCS